MHPAMVDPTRVVQGIVTGVGFLGAGVIMKEGLNIGGLTTAASIWASSAIGVLVGVGFYAAAIRLTGLSTVLMVWGSRIESPLPSRHAIGVTLRFAPAQAPNESELCARLQACGYERVRSSIGIQAEWQFVAVALDKSRGWSLPHFAEQLAQRSEAQRLRLSHARN